MVSRSRFRELFDNIDVKITLRAVQFKGNTSAKSVAPVQITTKISEVSSKKPGER